MSTPPYTGRLAPSPTGLLHLGHARTFFIAHQRARAANGVLYLRDEDLDPQRSRPEFSAAMREDLLWLGLAWDAELRQSTRLPLYLAALQQLLAAGLVYPCSCSRRDLALSVHAPHEDPAAESDDEPLYNNHCRPAEPVADLSGPAADLLNTRRPRRTYRFRTPDHSPVSFTDLHAGPQTFTTSKDFGDFLIWRKPLTSNPSDIGLPSYQLACVVDDALTHVTEVVRGRDLLKSTARQILLQRALHYPTPAYFHCDLMRDSNGVRLAKRHDALALRTLRANGLSPADVLALF
ncbi:MAG TPA: tRNA glutamyl-Q(34) synthetase GluQRS [Acidobacteriaceae bacterium]|nr:tRNA glutamyl-Q(34) synthetase GluQRS [Acidobacteriaceae bacterium]